MGARCESCGVVPSVSRVLRTRRAPPSEERSTPRSASGAAIDSSVHLVSCNHAACCYWRRAAVLVHSWQRCLCHHCRVGGGVDERSNSFALALQHSWDWFAVHSTQRMQLASFYLGAVGFTSAAYAASLGSGHNGAAIGISLFVVLLSAAFYALDRRTVELVKASERALAMLEAELDTALSMPQLRLVENVERPQGRNFSYSKTLTVLAITVSLAAVGACLYAMLGPRASVQGHARVAPVSAVQDSSR